MKAITVSQLNNYIKQVFEAEELLHYIEVVGDVDGLRQVGNAVYFTLKDDAAVINCVCYYPDKMRGTTNGNQVVVRGTVSYWHKAGKISFTVHSCEAFGWGQLFLKFQQLQEKLKKEGLFDAGVKKSLPSEIKRVGVVTSKQGAVIHDISSVAMRRNPNVDIVVYDVRVQGEGAENEIARGIEIMDEAKVDVIIVARGGGSKEDLSAFNSEAVARAVFACSKAVVSAVGHESDWTLIDFVASLRAPTPSVAAEICVAEVVTMREGALRALSMLRSVIMRKSDSILVAAKDMYSTLKNTVLFKAQEIENRVNVVATQIEANNPMSLLRRGFTRTNKQFAELKSGDEMEIIFYNGTVGAEVKWTKKKTQS